MNNKDYKDTLNLPKTEFPMKASLVNKEPVMLEKWEKMNIYEKIIESRKNKPSYILHDGPPYANGEIHMGTALNKVLKDLVVKSRTMLGFYSPYVPGWDCHGLPIELQVDRMLGEEKKKKSIVEFRNECKNYARKYIDIQREQFKRLGILGRWDRPYLTMTPGYQATIARTFGNFAKKGLVYRDIKPIHWCNSCRTALAEAEIEYGDHVSPSIYVKFAVDESWSGKLSFDEIKKASVVIWTTTPWTLPANLGIALHPDAQYIFLKVGDELYLIAENLLETFKKELNITESTVVKKILGKELKGLTTNHPLFEKKSLMVLADYVSMEQGTGCVHTAPGHGQEDYITGLEYGLKPFSPLDDYGRFTKEIPQYEGINVFAANDIIVGDLKKFNKLLRVTTLQHSYPHCWRCKNPVIFRATDQWFISLNKQNIREKSLQEIKKITWIPQWGEERIYQMVETRPDWCISRQRMWGVPITQFRCQDCGVLLEDERIYDTVADIYEKEGADAWYTKSEQELLPPGITCICGSTAFKKGYDILDVWFDSGTSHRAVLDREEELSWPADLYLEGNDQYRGWFNSSLLIGVQLYDKAPYRICVTHGMVVDEKGYKMSKSMGNFIDPKEIIKKYGAEILRAWVAMVDYKEEVKVSFPLLEKIAESYRKLRNTCRFMLGTTSDFQPHKDSLPFSNLTELDRWALLRTKQLEDKIIKAYEDYEFHTVYHSLQNFCVVDLSSFYLNVLKDRLYILKHDSLERRSAQTAIYHILDSMVRLMAPIYSFTAEEVWGYIPRAIEPLESVHLAEFIRTDVSYLDEDYLKRWEQFLLLREKVLKELELAREKGLIHDSLEALITITVPAEKFDLYEKHKDILKEIFVVSQLELLLSENDIMVQVERSKGSKCLRCWNYDEAVGTFSDNHDVCTRCYRILKEYTNK